MRKLYLILSLLFIAACNKYEVPFAPNDSQLISRAKGFFNQQIEPRALNAPKTLSPDYMMLPERKVHWEKAIVKELAWGKTVIVPVSLALNPSDDNGSTKYDASKLASLIIYEDNKGKKYAEFTIKMPDQDAAPDRFTGTVVVMDWSGKILPSFRYKKVRKNGITTIEEEGVTIKMFDKKSKPQTEDVELYCQVIDWFSCASYGSFPTICSYNYSTLICSGGNTGMTSSGYVYSPVGGLGGASYNTIPSLYNDYPLAKTIGFIKFDTAVKVYLPPCATQIFNTLRQDTAGFFGRIIYRYAETVPNFKWEIKVGTIASGKNATTVLDPVRGVMVTTLSTDYVNNATKASLGRTFLHEAIHAYLAYYFRFNPGMATKEYAQMNEEYNKQHYTENAASHQEMARNLAQNIASNLQRFGAQIGLNLPNQYYTDLAWGGLYETTYFDALDEEAKNRTIAIVGAEATGKRFTGPDGRDAYPQSPKACN